MKKLITLLLMMITLSVVAQKKDSPVTVHHLLAVIGGNELMILPDTIDLDALNSKPKSQSDLYANARPVSGTIVKYKGEAYPIFRSSTNSKLFIVVKAKTSGNYYRKYIKPS